MTMPRKLKIGDHVYVRRTEANRDLHGYHGEIEQKNGDEFSIRFFCRVANKYETAWINQRHLELVEDKSGKN